MNDIAKWREMVMWYGIALADLIAETNLGRADALLADTQSLLTLGGCLDADTGRRHESLRFPADRFLAGPARRRPGLADPVRQPHRRLPAAVA